MTKFTISGPDKKGRIFIIEGTPNGQVISLKRVVCEIVEEQSPEITMEVAEFVCEALNKMKRRV